MLQLGMGTAVPLFEPPVGPGTDVAEPVMLVPRAMPELAGLAGTQSPDATFLLRTVVSAAFATATSTSAASVGGVKRGIRRAR